MTFGVVVKPALRCQSEHEVNSFVGRRRELRELRSLLSAHRLVTLTGVGGVGKSRLAHRTAATLRRAYDEIQCVNLADPRDPQLLTQELQNPELLAHLIAGALGVHESATRMPLELLCQWLAPRRLLLVLDNCEHLLPACAVLTDTLLRQCPHLQILATSREPFQLTGETIFPVPPLLTPEPSGQVSVAALDRNESVSLFVARAQAIAADFALNERNADAVAELCRRLDGLPLAIELAAARVRVLTPAQILERLGQRFTLLTRGSNAAPERQRTLRACVDSSFELCSKPERVLWARLSVFVGGFELDAIEAVCADEVVPAEDLLDLVAALVDKSIVTSESHRGVLRYRMLETIRDYGQDELRSSGMQPQLVRRHRDWYRQFVRQAVADWFSPRQANWSARLDQELPNVRAALDFSLADPDGADPDGADPDGAESALEMAAGLQSWWNIRGLQSEGRAWLDQALAQPTGPTMTRVKALYGNAALAAVQGDLPTVSRCVRQAWETAAQLVDPRAQAIASAADGVLATARGDLPDAVQCWQRAVDGLADEQAEEYLVWRVTALLGLAMAKGLQSDADGAVAAYESILAICEPRGEYSFSGLALCAQGLGLWKRGDSTAAAARLQEGLHRLRRVNDIVGTARCLVALAWIAVDERQPARAATLLGAATRLAHATDVRTAGCRQLSAHSERYEQDIRAALGERAYRAAWARGERLCLDEAITYALNKPHKPAAPSVQEASTPLTRREQQVANLVAKGMSNREIASTLVISQRTAESHVEKILVKLGYSSRVQVAAWIMGNSASGQAN